MTGDELDQESQERLRRFLEGSAHHPTPVGFDARVVPHARPRWRRSARMLGTGSTFAVVAVGMVTAILVTTGGTPKPAPTAPTPTPSAYRSVQVGTAMANLADGGWRTLTTIAITPVVLPRQSSGVTALASVACPARDDCWAVGDGNGTGGLIDHYDGTRWTVIDRPVTGLISVSCPAVDACWAVGSTVSQVPQPVIERYDGVAWSVIQGPVLGGAGTLAGVSCADAEHCWAVGYAGAADANTAQPLLEAYDGTGWTVVDGPPTPDAAAGGVSALDAVTCVTADDCWAVGTDSPADSGLIEHYDGTGWSVVPDVAGSGTGASLMGVTCVGAGDCWAVGDDVVVHYDGTAWSTVSTPLTGTAFPGLLAVACASSDQCWAVGGTMNADRGWGTVILHWQGDAWTTVTTLPSRLDLEGIACPAAGDCWVVGAVIGLEPLSQSPGATPPLGQGVSVGVA